MQQGWKAPKGRFDVLPLLLQANGNDPELFEIPEDLILEVHMSHPKWVTGSLLFITDIDIVYLNAVFIGYVYRLHLYAVIYGVFILFIYMIN